MKSYKKFKKIPVDGHIEEISTKEEKRIRKFLINFVKFFEEIFIKCRRIFLEIKKLY